MIPNRNTGKNNGMSTNPNVVSNPYRISILQTLVTTLGIQRMTCRINPHIRSDESIISDRHLCTIQNNEIDIGIEILAYLNIIPIVAVKRRLNNHLISDFSQQRP